MAGGLGDKGGAVPVLARVVARRVQSMTCPRGEMAVIVDLADLVGDRLDGSVARNTLEHPGRPAAHCLIVSVRNRQVHARVAVRRRAEEDALLAEAYAPRIIVGVAQELHLRAVRLETVEALAEPVMLAANHAVEASIAH